MLLLQQVLHGSKATADNEYNHYVHIMFFGCIVGYGQTLNIVEPTECSNVNNNDSGYRMPISQLGSDVAILNVQGELLPDM